MIKLDLFKIQLCSKTFWCLVTAGDRQWKDTCFRHPYHRNTAEERRKTEEDAGTVTNTASTSGELALCDAGEERGGLLFYYFLFLCRLEL